MKFEGKLASLPDVPGIYMMKDITGRVIYVGKAKSIRKRIPAYFQSPSTYSPRTFALISNVRDLQYIVTRNEKEALILENELIKYFHPKYNIALRDDKTYPHLKLTIDEDFPKLVMARISKKERVKHRMPGIKYFGPYPDVSSLKRTLKTIQRIFPLVKCSKSFFLARRKEGNPSSCLDFHLGQCLAPCVEWISKEDYRKIVEKVVLFLSGKGESLLKKLKEEMKGASRQLDFEKAKIFRDQIGAIQSISQRVNLRQVEKQKLKAAGKGEILIELQKAIELENLPERIEAFDISDIYGDSAVGSMVVFSGGKPENKSYRKFKIKMVTGIDDVGMMKEVIHRRYTRLIKEKGLLPDLILVDGGKGQVNGAKGVLNELGLGTIPVVGLAKGEELIFLPQRSRPIRLPFSSPVLHLIQHIRDEAHRFAIRYHRLLRKKKLIGK
ncbi:MAG TPA: excinuclease ABC subunit UvrC [bacterium]|nr:excinuclease ABC subunit UvrC [bacterium]